MGSKSFLACSCGCTNHRVVDSRIDTYFRKRRIECVNCGERSNTYEISAKDFSKFLYRESEYLKSKREQLLTRLASERSGVAIPPSPALDN